MSTRNPAGLSIYKTFKSLSNCYMVRRPIIQPHAPRCILSACKHAFTVQHTASETPKIWSEYDFCTSAKVLLSWMIKDKISDQWWSTRNTDAKQQKDCHHSEHGIDDERTADCCSLYARYWWNPNFSRLSCIYCCRIKIINLLKKSLNQLAKKDRMAKQTAEHFSSGLFAGFMMLLV